MANRQRLRTKEVEMTLADFQRNSLNITPSQFAQTYGSNVIIIPESTREEVQYPGNPASKPPTLDA